MADDPRSPQALARDIGGVLVHYVSAQIRICLILAALYAVGFALLRVPLWPVMALLVGLAHAIPMFGATVAIIVVAALTWMAQDVYSAMGVMGIFAVAQVLEGFWLTPRIMGRRLQLSPWWVFVGALVAGMMFGFVGLLLVIPAMAVVMVVYRFVRAKQDGGPVTPS